MKKIKSMKDNKDSELELKGDTITIQVHNKFQSIPVKGDKNQFHFGALFGTKVWLYKNDHKILFIIGNSI